MQQTLSVVVFVGVKAELVLAMSKKEFGADSFMESDSGGAYLVFKIVVALQAR